MNSYISLEMEMREGIEVPLSFRSFLEAYLSDEGRNDEELARRRAELLGDVADWEGIPLSGGGSR